MDNRKFDKKVRHWWVRNGATFGLLIRIAFFLLAMGMFIEMSEHGTKKFDLYHLMYFFVVKEVLSKIIK